MKTIKIFSAALMMVLFLSGCHSFNNNHRTLQHIVDHFRYSNLHVQVVQPLFPYFNSENAVSMTIKGKEIGVYKYNINVPKQRQRLERIADEKYVFVEGMKFPVLVNGTFMLLGYEVNPERDKIIEVFEKFPN